MCLGIAGSLGQRSIGRAEALVDYLIGAASNIAAAINTYKKEEFNAQE